MNRQKLIKELMQAECMCEAAKQKFCSIRVQLEGVSTPSKSLKESSIDKSIKKFRASLIKKQMKKQVA